MKTHLLAGLLLLELLIFASVSGFYFLGPANLAEIFVKSGKILVPAFGMTLILMTGGIDLSIGSAVALLACILGRLTVGPTLWVWTPIILILGLLLGLFNGVLIGIINIPPIIATLGTMILFRGLCYVIVGDVEYAPFRDVRGFELLGGFTTILLLAVILYVGIGIYFENSRWRREICVLGGNPVAARYAGISHSRRILEVYAFMGLLAAVTSLFWAGRNLSVRAGIAEGLELQVVVAVVLGGTRVQGGSGSLIGTFLGVMLIAVLEEGFRSTAAVLGAHGVQLPFDIQYLQLLLIGVLLLTGVWLSTKSKRI